MLVDTCLTVNTFTSFPKNIWRRRIAPEHRQVVVPISWLVCSLFVVMMWRICLIFSFENKGGFPPLFPFLYFSSSLSLSFATAFPLFAVLSFFILSFFFYYFSFLLMQFYIPFMYLMATPFSTPSRIVRSNVRDDQPFWVARYMNNFHDCPDAGPFAAMSPSRKAQTVRHERHGWKCDTSVGTWMKRRLH